MNSVIGLAHVGTFGAATLVCVAGGERARRVSGDAGTALAGFLFVTAAWAGVETVRFATPDPAAKLVLYPVGLVVGLLAVYAWLWFCVAYADVDVPGWARTAAAAVFVAVSALKLTNWVHGLYFTARVAESGLLVVELGLVHWAVTGAAYVAAGGGFLLLFRRFGAEGRDTRYLTALVLLLFVPVLPTLLSLAVPAVPAVFYEPLGAAAFALALLVAVEDEFTAVAPPARHQLPERLDVPVLVADEDDRVVDHNGAAGALFPALDDGSPELGALAPSLGVGGDEAVVPVETGEGTRYFLRRHHPVEAAGRAVGRVVVLSDVTELEAARRELTRQNEQLDEFAEAVTHELRNPLNVVLGNVARARGGVTDADALASLDAAADAGERMCDIVDDLTTMTEYGKSVSSREPRPLADLVAAAWAELDADGATLDAAGTATVEVDHARYVEMCRRTFASCLDRGATRVEVTPTDGGFRVEADAPSLDADTAARLFEYGHQAESDDRLGLSLVDTLAAAQGWEVRADHEAPRLCFEFVSATSLAPAP